ncbi:DUF4350 domain-containing protein [Leifsonia sp. NPDC058292]|uniref:DUF4350 domain-containing protein n=1 Tax=Leifsonia sp. NPDC058292 TaxID=3346428 RepID=UPI0036D8C977
MTSTVSHAPERAREPADAPALTPGVRQATRRSIPWIVLAVIAVVIALIGIAFSRTGAGVGVPLDASNAGPVGSRALVEVLRQQGVTVSTATSLAEVRATASGDATVLVYDPDGNLDRAGYQEVSDAAGSVVVVEPDDDALQQLAPGIAAAGRPGGTGEISAACSLPAAVAAKRIDPTPTDNTAGASLSGTFRITSGDATGCFRSGNGQFSLVQTTTGWTRVSVLGSATLLMNDTIDRSGNAALALNLLGEHRTLVWYLPGLADRPASGPPALSELTPGWVTPVMILLVLVFIAAAFWRGRRFGPLVVENLPVVVRAGETREGRARLYQRSSARLRAADALRIGAIARLATVAGLPQTATATEISDAIAALTGRDRNVLRSVLIDSIPHTDRELIDLSDTIAELERAAAAAVSPAPGGPTGRMDA